MCKLQDPQVKEQVGLIKPYAIYLYILYNIHKIYSYERLDTSLRIAFSFVICVV